MRVRDNDVSNKKNRRTIIIVEENINEWEENNHYIHENLINYFINYIYFIFQFKILL